MKPETHKELQLRDRIGTVRRKTTKGEGGGLVGLKLVLLASSIGRHSGPGQSAALYYSRASPLILMQLQITSICSIRIYVIINTRGNFLGLKGGKLNTVISGGVFWEPFGSKDQLKVTKTSGLALLGLFISSSVI